MKKNIKVELVGNYGTGHHAKNVYNPNGLAPTITTGNHGLGTAIIVYEKEERKLKKRIRKKTNC